MATAKPVVRLTYDYGDDGRKALVEIVDRIGNKVGLSIFDIVELIERLEEIVEDYGNGEKARMAAAEKTERTENKPHSCSVAVAPEVLPYAEKFLADLKGVADGD